MHCSDELKEELQLAGVKLEHIQDMVDQALGVMERMDTKLDNIDTKLDNYHVETLSVLVDTNETTRAIETTLKDLQQKQAERDQRDALDRHEVQMARKQMQADLKAIRGATGTAVKEIYSDMSETKLLAQEYIEMCAKPGLDIILVHAHGVGIESFKGFLLNGSDGETGKNGKEGDPGKDGMSGQSGQNGVSGMNGFNGSDAKAGKAAENFTVRINLADENKEKKIQRIAITVEGPEGHHTEEITVNDGRAIIQIVGRGGCGGKGGDGGNGGAGGKGGDGGHGVNGVGQQPGGNGGMGGGGGAGGNGARAGRGGNGGAGATVTIRTATAAVLALVRVDVMGGVAGLHGHKGMAGRGGNFGKGAPGGAGGTWTTTETHYREDSEGKRTSYDTHTQHRAPDGGAGMDGSSGQSGLEGEVASVEEMIPGTLGSVSFCVYTDDGDELAESAGLPFRLSMRHKPEVIPYSLISDVDCLSDMLVYGQQMRYGPVIPSNFGPMTAPPSKLNATLVVEGVDVVVHGFLSYPSIPACPKSKTSKELDAIHSRVLTLDIPRISATSFALMNRAWPWNVKGCGANASIRSATLHTQLYVDGNFPLFNLKNDGDHVPEKTYNLSATVPISLVNDFCEMPVSIFLAGNSTVATSDTTFLVSFEVKNNLAGISTKTLQGYTYVLQIAGEKYAPSVNILTTSHAKGVVDSNRKPLSALQGWDGRPFEKESSFYPITVTGDIPLLDKLKSASISGFAITPHVSAEPGSRILVRAELYCDNMMIQYSSPSLIRMVSPPPPTTNVRMSDVLVFVTGTLYADDYRAIETIMKFVALRVFFMDYEHVMDVALWKSQYDNKCCCVWMPTESRSGEDILINKFQQHLVNGGGLLVGGKFNTFTATTECKSMSKVQGRRAVFGPNENSLLNLKDGCTVDNNGSQLQLLGGPATVFVQNILMTFSTDQKLSFLFENRDGVCKHVLGTETLCVYEPVLTPTCCGIGEAKIKILPTKHTAYTIRDCLLVALAADLHVDITSFEQTSDIKLCFALSAIVGKCD